jgi:V/A-type H+-transporting ATPase subunit I
MAISLIQKVMIAVHRSQAGQLISALQDAGIVQILDAERAMVSKEWPELEVESKRPKETEELVVRLDKAVAFLNQYGKGKDGRSIFAPLIEVDQKSYTDIVHGSFAKELLDRAEQTQTTIDKLNSRAEALRSEIHKLLPWKELQTPIEQLGQLSSAVCLAGILPKQHFNEAVEAVVQIGAAVQMVGGEITTQPCLVFGIKESAQEIQKILRSFEFEVVGFEGIRGTVSENLSRRQKELAEIDAKLKETFKTARQLAGEKLKLEILADHYHNLLIRKQTQATAPETETTLFLESWVREKDYPKLMKIVESFDGAVAEAIEPAEGEEVPVEIENGSMIRPFESITRLYGMPIPSSIDPTVFLAPFFAIFFGLCMADAGYGLILVALLAWAIKKAQGDKKILWMLLVCSVTTFLAGVITGSWFGDAITSMLGVESSLETVRVKLMLFDPMTEPMTFFLLALALGYFQIQCGLLIAFFANLIKKDWAAAICDQLIWVIHLNSLLCLGLANGGILPAAIVKPCVIIAIFTSLTILLSSVRSGGWGGRIGLGVYQLFSTVFYVGDVLSYARLMALSLVGSGFGMAINILVNLLADIPYIGWLLGAALFVGGHLFNIALSVLGAFVHSLRLQFVEFFPKFFTGGGIDFIPLRKEYRHIQVKQEING